MEWFSITIRKTLCSSILRTYTDAGKLALARQTLDRVCPLTVKAAGREPLSRCYWQSKALLPFLLLVFPQLWRHVVCAISFLDGRGATLAELQVDQAAARVADVGQDIILPRHLGNIIPVYTGLPS